MCTSLHQSVFPAHWCADHSKNPSFLAGGISESLSPFSSRLRRSLVGSAAKTLFRGRLQYRQLRRLDRSGLQICLGVEPGWTIFVEYHRRSLPWFYVRVMIYSEPLLTVECKCHRDGPGDLFSLCRFHCHIR